jgi:hypothetical protein
MKRRYHRIVMVVLALVLMLVGNGCGGLHSRRDPSLPFTSTITRTPSRTPTATRTATPTRTPTKTSTPIPSRTPIPTESYTPSPVTIPNQISKCIKMKDSAPPALDGWVVLSGHRIQSSGESIRGQSYLLNMTSGETIELGATYAESVSPDGHWLAYNDFDQDDMMVTDLAGKKYGDIPAEGGKLKPAYWLDNQRVIINDCRDCVSIFQTGKTLIYNPFTGEKRTWTTNLPKQVSSFLATAWSVTTGMIPDPTLSHVIYRRDDDHFPLILWDLLVKKEDVRLYSASDDNTPVWSPDGFRFVTDAPIMGDGYTNIDDGFPYQGGEDLILVDKNSKVQRLTYFTVEQDVIEFDYVWSPGGKKIGFLLGEYSQEIDPRLMVVDVASGEVADLCKAFKLPTYSDFNVLLYPPDVIFSLDERYLVFTDLDRSFRYRVILVDLETADAWQIASNVSAVGWMVPEP